MKDIWGDDPTAAYLKQEWGEEVFYASALHALALDEAERQKKRAAEMGKHTRPAKGAKKR